LLATRPQLVDGELGANEYDALLQALMDVGGAYYRTAWFNVPGSELRLRLVEIINNQEVFGLRGVRQTSASYTDGGGIAMRLAVPDLAALKDELDRTYTGDLLTTGGAPIRAGSARLTVRDDEGVVMELVELSALTSGGTDPAIGTSVVLTAANAKEKLEFYQDLGFEFAAGDWEASGDVLAAVGATAGRVRWHAAQMPGVDVPLMIAEFQGTKQRRFFPTTMGQSGAGWLQFVVRDLEAVVEELRAKRVLRRARAVLDRVVRVVRRMCIGRQRHAAEPKRRFDVCLGPPAACHAAWVSRSSPCRAGGRSVQVPSWWSVMVWPRWVTWSW
jgi:hypothetical protein